MFEFVLQNDVQRNLIAKFFPEDRKTPLRKLDCMNINLAYGVYDKDNDIFLTLVYFVSRSIVRTDYIYDYSDYAVIKNGKIFKIHTTYNENQGFGELSIPFEYQKLEPLIKNAVECYENNGKMRNFTQTCEEHNSNFKVYRLREDMLKKYYNI